MRILRNKPEYCMKCHACEKTCSRKWFDEKNLEKARLRIIEPVTGMGVPRMITCTQCGTCKKACPNGAIYRDEAGIVKIDEEKCVACYTCVAACPEEAMFKHEDYRPPFKCIACGECARVCPTSAVHIKEEPLIED